MSTLSSSSTRDEIHAAYLDNASYEEDGDAGKCRAFITACRFLVSPRISPKRSKGTGSDGGEIELDLTIIRDEMRDAQSWLAQNGDASGEGGVKHPDFANFRD